MLVISPSNSRKSDTIPVILLYKMYFDVNTSSPVRLKTVWDHDRITLRAMPHWQLVKYPPLTFDTEENSCFSKHENSEMLKHKKMILTHSFLQ